MIDSMLMCLSSDLCLCSCIFLCMYWLANGVMPCCRLCRLGHCRVIQSGWSAEGSIHWVDIGDYWFFYCSMLFYLYSAVLMYHFLYLSIPVPCFVFNMSVPCCKIRWTCCQARVRIHCEILAPWHLESFGFGVLQSWYQSPGWQQWHL